MSIDSKQPFGMGSIFLRFFFVLTAASSVAASPAAGWPQESVRNVEEPGTFKKYLTPSTLDRWIFTGKQGQLVVANVRTTEFDAILKLVRVVEETEQLLLEIDDEGSHAHFATRLPADGQYKVVVHGYEFKGGGNYSLSLEQYAVDPAEVDGSTSGTLDEKGVGWLYFSAGSDDFVQASVLGAAGTQFQIRDPQGVPVPLWAGLAHLEKGGEYYLRVDGPNSARFELRLNLASRGPLALDGDASRTLSPRSAWVLDLPADGPPLGVIELEVTGDVAAQLVPSGLSGSFAGSRLAQASRRPRFLEIPSKGAFRRFAMVRDEEARYQLRMVSERGGRVHVRYRDPRQDLGAATKKDGLLPVGSVHFFRLPAEQGRAVTLTCRSADFDSELRLYDLTGQLLAADDDGGGGLDARLRHLPFVTAELIVAVHARGYGGGGRYQLEVGREAPQQLELGGRMRGELGAGEVGFYSLPAAAGQKILLHLHSEVENAQLQILNANGVELRNARAGQERDLAMVHEFLEAGPYAILVTLPREGMFQLRAIDD